MYFGGDSILGNAFLYGLSDYIDPRNDTLTGNGVAFTDSILADFASASPAQKGRIIGRVVAHEVGHMLGLRHVNSMTDLMSVTPVWDSVIVFQTSPLAASEQFNAQIGFQDGPDLLEQVLGLAPVAAAHPRTTERDAFVGGRTPPVSIAQASTGSAARRGPPGQPAAPARGRSRSASPSPPLHPAWARLVAMLSRGNRS